MKDTNSLSHTSYRCKYHIVIVPKYRRMVIYNRLRRDIVEILTLLINRKPDVKLIEGETCPDHIHMLLEIPPKYAVSDFMGYLKSKSTLMIFDRHANLKYKYGSEADMLNVALFNKRAKQWCEENPELKGNIRDYASLNDLLVLANMESYNAVLISKGLY